MTTRELFESKFPVPDGVVWHQNLNEYLPANPENFEQALDAVRISCCFNGFQAGYAAAKEGK